MQRHGSRARCARDVERERAVGCRTWRTRRSSRSMPRAGCSSSARRRRTCSSTWRASSSTSRVRRRPAASSRPDPNASSTRASRRHRERLRRLPSTGRVSASRCEWPAGRHPGDRPPSRFGRGRGDRRSTTPGRRRASRPSTRAGGDRPTTSNVNVNAAPDVRANLVVVPLGTDGARSTSISTTSTTSRSTSSATTPAADRPSDTAGRFHLLAPKREVDTRIGLGFGRLGVDQNVHAEPGERAELGVGRRAEPDDRAHRRAVASSPPTRAAPCPPCRTSTRAGRIRCGRRSASPACPRRAPRPSSTACRRRTSSSTPSATSSSAPSAHPTLVCVVFSAAGAAGRATQTGNSGVGCGVGQVVRPRG